MHIIKLSPMSLDKTVTDVSGPYQAERWAAIEPVRHSEIPQPHDILSHAINKQIKHDVNLP
jgi:hypothetical protein